MKLILLVLVVALLLAGTARAATSPAAQAEETVVMKPFVVAAANITADVKWLTNRRSGIQRVLFMQVSMLSERSAAYAAGLRVHMVIDAIDGKSVEDATQEELARIMAQIGKKNKYVTITVLQGLDKRKIRISLDDAAIQVRK